VEDSLEAVAYPRGVPPEPPEGLLREIRTSVALSVDALSTVSGLGFGGRMRGAGNLPILPCPDLRKKAGSEGTKRGHERRRVP